jgi:hypothetical protein
MYGNIMPAIPEKLPNAALIQVTGVFIRVRAASWTAIAAPAECPTICDGTISNFFNKWPSPSVIASKVLQPKLGTLENP